MFCSNCGSNVPDNSSFCTNCGKKMVSAPAPASAPAAATNSATHTMADSYASKALTWGIIGLAFASSFYLSFLGIIFSAIGRSKAKSYRLMTGTLTGRAKVGASLALAGLILGIVLTVALTIYVIFLVAVISRPASLYYYF